MPPRTDCSASRFWGGTLWREASMSFMAEALADGRLLRSGFGNDDDLDLSGQAGAEFDPDGKFAERLDRLVQKDAFFADLDPLGDQRLLDVLRTHGAEEFLLLSDAACNRTGHGTQFGGHLLGLFLDFIRLQQDALFFVLEGLEIPAV